MKEMIKICGLSTPEAIIAARDGGATHLGFIFFEKSPRNITPQLAAELAVGAGECATVAVTVSADDDFLDGIVGAMAPSMLQLHGNESPDRVADLKVRHGLPVMKALAIRAPDDLERMRAYEGIVDLFLLDAKPPKGSELPGGNGVSFDWSLLAGLETGTPVVLSGGIDLDNVRDAVSRVGDPATCLTGIDVSSGVESAPGVKDPAKISALLAACR